MKRGVGSWVLLAVLVGAALVASPGAQAGNSAGAAALVIQPGGVVDAGALAAEGPDAASPTTEIPLRVPDPARLRRMKQDLETERLLEPPGAGPPLGPATGLQVLNTFQGLRFTDTIGAIPPDTQAAAGPNHVFEVVNVSGRILTKTGTALLSFSLKGFFGLPRLSPVLLFDPKIRFDQASGRWFVLAATDEGSFGSWRLAVSTSSDPTGSYALYVVPTPGSVPDFPAIGISDDKVILTANAFQCTIVCDGPFVGTEFLVLNKAQLVAGAATNATFFLPDQGIFTIQPAHALSSTTTHYMAAVDFPSATSIRIWSVTGVPGVGPGVSVATVDRSIGALSVPPGAAQMGTPAPVETNDNRLLEAVYRNGSLWVTANAACTPSGDVAVRACLRFVQILTAGLTVNQDFDFGVAGVHHYFAAIQTDSLDNLVAVFSRSSASEFASVYAGMRLAGDPPNTLQAPVLVKAGEAAYDPLLGGFAARRWGDYSGAAIDPSDPTTVWVAGEYARIEGGAEWGTWIARVRFAPYPSVGLSLSKVGPSFTQKAFSAGERIRVGVTVANLGPTVSLDVYFGALLPASAGPGFGCPNGDALVFLADAFAKAVVACLSGPPQSFAPLYRAVAIPGALPATTIPAFFEFVWGSNLPPGDYVFFIVLVLPQAFADGRTDSSVLVAIGADVATFAP